MPKVFNRIHLLSDDLIQPYSLDQNGFWVPQQRVPQEDQLSCRLHEAYEIEFYEKAISPHPCMDVRFDLFGSPVTERCAVPLVRHVQVSVLAYDAEARQMLGERNVLCLPDEGVFNGYYWGHMGQKTIQSYLMAVHARHNDVLQACYAELTAGRQSGPLPQPVPSL